MAPVSFHIFMARADAAHLRLSLDHGRVESIWGALSLRDDESVAFRAARAWTDCYLVHVKLQVDTEVALKWFLAGTEKRTWRRGHAGFDLSTVRGETGVVGSIVKGLNGGEMVGDRSRC